MAYDFYLISQVRFAIALWAPLCFRRFGLRCRTLFFARLLREAKRGPPLVSRWFFSWIEVGPRDRDLPLPGLQGRVRIERSFGRVLSDQALVCPQETERGYPSHQRTWKCTNKPFPRGKIVFLQGCAHFHVKGGRVSMCLLCPDHLFNNTQAPPSSPDLQRYHACIFVYFVRREFFLKINDQKSCPCFPWPVDLEKMIKPRGSGSKGVPLPARLRTRFA